jgi:uncharacterized membrane protein YjgN (DUF898 family)
VAHYTSLIGLVGFPFVLQRYYRFVVSQSSYGTTPFQFHSSVGEYYWLAGKLLLVVIIGVILVGLIGSVTVALTRSWFGPQVRALSFLLPLLLLYVWVIAVYVSSTTNLMYNGLLIPGWYTFSCTTPGWGIFRVYLKNTVLIILTVGSYIPVAKIRLLEYRLRHLRFCSSRSIDEFAFENVADVEAIGQETGEIFDLGLSL